jgi:DNA gyrase subunit A
MARKKNADEKKISNPDVIGLQAQVLEQPITQTLEVNFMPYAMSVIMSRAIPEIDGFKPSHRKLLYTMYKMGLLTGARTKSANIVGQTMRLNPHGDAAIYETMVRLSKGYEALLTPFVDSKGNFGKVYSRDMAYAASRYTEAKLAPLCAERCRDIERDTVDFVNNYKYDAGATLLRRRFQTFSSAPIPHCRRHGVEHLRLQLAEVARRPSIISAIRTTILWRRSKPRIFHRRRNPLQRGGDRRHLQDGRGSFKVRARWRYNKQKT